MHNTPSMKKVAVWDIEATKGLLYDMMHDHN